MLEDANIEIRQRKITLDEDSVRDLTTVWVESPDVGSELAERMAIGLPEGSFRVRAASVLKALSAEFPFTAGRNAKDCGSRLLRATLWTLGRIGSAPSPDEALVLRRTVLPTLVGRLRGLQKRGPAVRKLIDHAFSVIAG